MMKAYFPWIQFRIAALIIWSLLFIKSTNAQLVDSIYLQKQWKADWITVPQTNPTGYGV